jgi:predicted lipoprotein with Yx(FWY)xxD motif
MKQKSLIALVATVALTIPAMSGASTFAIPKMSSAATSDNIVLAQTQGMDRR